MKKIIVIITAIFFLFSSYISAQDHFDINLKLGTQSVLNKSIPVDITLNSNINSNKVEITSSTPSALEFEYLGKQYFSVEKGETYNLKAIIRPKKEGNYRISVNAIAWGEDGVNFSSSESINLQIDKNLKKSPQTKEYARNIVLLYIGIIILSVPTIYFGTTFSKKHYKKFKVWLLPKD